MSQKITWPCQINICMAVTLFQSHIFRSGRISSVYIVGGLLLLVTLF